MIGSFDKDKLIAIGKYFPAYLVFLGSLKLIIFYKSFDIKIVEYLDFSEVLISFLDSIIFYISTLALPILIAWSFWGKTIGEINLDEFQKNIQLTFYQRLLKTFKKNKILYIIITIFTITIIFLGKWDEAKIAILIGFPGIWIIFFIVDEIQIAYKKQYDYYIPHTYHNIFIILFIITSFIIKDTLNDVTEIKHHHKYYGSEIQFENEKIKSDSVIDYIGQTRNFIFFYNLNKKESIIYPKSKVISIKLIGK